MLDIISIIKANIISIVVIYLLFLWFAYTRLESCTTLVPHSPVHFTVYSNSGCVKFLALRTLTVALVEMWSPLLSSKLVGQG